MWTPFIDSYKWERNEYFLVGSRHSEAHNMLCFVGQPGSAVVEDLSDNDDEVDDDIHSHFNRPPPKRVPKKGGETVEGARPSTSGCRDDGSP
ncbi:hypothetical protein A2U01_0072649, partial [Trifolium medium]|nr:hypothetical protein [Trifolium medium]